MKTVNSKAKHVPMRTCIVTREKMPKKDLVRLVRTPDGKVVVDRTGKSKGRGANLSQNIEVFDTAVSKGLLRKALKLESPLSLEQIEELREEFKHAIEEKQFRPNNKPVSIRVDKSQLEKLGN